MTEETPKKEPKPKGKRKAKSTANRSNRRKDRAQPKKQGDESRARASSDPGEAVKRMMEDAEREAKIARIIELMESKALSITGAAQIAEVSRQTLYRWMAADSQLSDDLRRAYDAGTDLLKDKAAERGLAMSDNLLLNTIKGRDPSWRDVKIAAPSFMPPQAAIDPNAITIPVDRLTPDELRQMRAIAQRLHASENKREPLRL